MSEASQVADARRAFMGRLFPDDIPPLWCNLLTHYGNDGAVDEKRTLAHLDHVANFVDGILTPGLVGDVWRLSEAERLRTLGLILDQATRLKLRILIAVLKPDTGSARACLVGTVEWLKARTGEPDTERCLHRRRVAAFTLCPPFGNRLPQPRVEEELDSLLVTGLPIALHNLPQATGNAAEPDTVARLAARHPNLVLFLENGDTHAAALAVPPDSGLFLVHGLDSDHHRSPRRAGGPYDGLLLGSANCFPKELRRLWRDLGRKRASEADRISNSLSSTLTAVRVIAGESPAGDPMTNALKAIDHYIAFGPHAAQVPPPRTHSGSRISAEVIRQTGDILKANGLLPEKGYLE